MKKRHTRKELQRKKLFELLGFKTHRKENINEYIKRYTAHTNDNMFFIFFCLMIPLLNLILMCDILICYYKDRLDIETELYKRFK